MSNGVLTKFTPLIHLTICCVCISLWVGPDHPKQTDAGKQQQRQLLSPKKAKLAEPLKKERGPGSSPSLTTTFITSALLPTRSQIHPSHLLISSPPGGVPSLFSSPNVKVGRSGMRYFSVPVTAPPPLGMHKVNQRIAVL